MQFKIGGIQKTSLLDYPDKISTIVFTQGCNFRCGYCHNPELLGSEEPKLSVSAFFEFLNYRKNKIDAVVITGGEPCLQKDLQIFIEKIKEENFLVKLDTNGTYPEKLKTLIDENLIDYAAMDIKSPLEKYNLITNSKVDIVKIKESIDILLNSNIKYEFRTTVLKKQLDFEDFEKIGLLIKGAEKYYLQKFVPSKILDGTLASEKSYFDEEFSDIINILKKTIKHANLR